MVAFNPLASVVALPDESASTPSPVKSMVSDAAVAPPIESEAPAAIEIVPPTADVPVPRPPASTMLPASSSVDLNAARSLPIVSAATLRTPPSVTTAMLSTTSNDAELVQRPESVNVDRVTVDVVAVKTPSSTTVPPVKTAVPITLTRPPSALVNWAAESVRPPVVSVPPALTVTTPPVCANAAAPPKPVPVRLRTAPPPAAPPSVNEPASCA